MTPRQEAEIRILERDIDRLNRLYGNDKAAMRTVAKLTTELIKKKERYAKQDNNECV